MPFSGRVQPMIKQDCVPRAQPFKPTWDSCNGLIFTPDLSMGLVETLSHVCGSLIAPLPNPVCCISNSTSASWRHGPRGGTRSSPTRQTVGWGLTTCPPTAEWINKMWYIHTLECYFVLKRKETLTYVTTWMNFGAIILTHISQPQ